MAGPYGADDIPTMMPTDDVDHHHDPDSDMREKRRGGGLMKTFSSGLWPGCQSGIGNSRRLDKNTLLQPLKYSKIIISPVVHVPSSQPAGTCGSDFFLTRVSKSFYNVINISGPRCQLLNL